MTLGDYYKHFVSLYGGLTAAIGSIPLLPFVLPKDYSRCLLPPIGPPQNLLGIALPLIAVLVTFIVYQAKDRAFIQNEKRFKFLCILAFLALASFIVYMGLSIRFVYTINNGPEPRTTVSVGYDRSELVKNYKDDKGTNPYASKTDIELLQEVGATERDVEASVYKLWTTSSIFWVRVGVFVSYLFCFLPFIGIGCFLILFDLLDKAPFHFRVSDFLHSDSFLNKLKNPQDALSKYLYEQLSPETHRLINQRVPYHEPGDELLKVLIRDLNKMIESRLLYEEKQFAHVELSERTREFEKHLHIGLNRKFLEDAYPIEIARSSLT
jgi:hypothetical protein